MFIRTIAAGVVVAVSMTGVVSATANSKTNHPSYWGDSCTKTEMKGEVMTFNAPEGATRVIVKGGTGHKVYDNAPFTNLTAPVNPKNGKTHGISHVIVCTGEVSTKPVTPTEKVTEKEKEAEKVTETTKPVETPKGGADEPAAPVMPETLPEVGAGAAAMTLAAAGATVAGALAHRRSLLRG